MKTLLKVLRGIDDFVEGSLEFLAKDKLVTILIISGVVFYLVACSMKR